MGKGPAMEQRDLGVLTPRAKTAKMSFSFLYRDHRLVVSRGECR